MRIDDRKVNGRIMLDALDSVDGFNILVESTGATWQWLGSMQCSGVRYRSR